MIRLALLLPLCLSLFQAAIAADIPSQEVPADAKWLLHLDAGRFRASRVGGYIVASLVEGQLRQPLAEMETNLQLNVDLHKVIEGIKSVTIYGMDYDSAQQNSVLMLRVSPELEKILLGVLAGMAFTGTNGPMHVTQTLEGPVNFFSFNNAAYCAVLPGKAILIARVAEAVEKSAKVLAGQQPSLTGDAAFTQFGDSPNGFFFLGFAEGFGSGNKILPQAKLFQAADAGKVVMGEEADRLFLRVALRGRTAEAVTQMQQVVQGLLAISSLSQPNDADLSLLLHSVQVATNENIVSVGVNYPVDRAILRLSQAQVRTKSASDGPSAESGDDDKDADPPAAAAAPSTH